MTARALSFGSVAADYERFRLGYPEALVDEVLAYAAAPVDSALEIGAGTGKATRAFTARGVAVTATDPDAAMLAELVRHVPGTVTTVQAAFEELADTAAYDLIFAAASLHWTVPEHRWSRVAALLRPGGTFASFGGPLGLADDDLAAAVAAAGAPDLVDDAVASPDGTPAGSALEWPGSELVASPLFTDVRQIVIEQRMTMSAADYVSHLATISAYLVLPATARDRVFTRILGVLPDVVPVAADLTLHLARRTAVA